MSLSLAVYFSVEHTLYIHNAAARYPSGSQHHNVRDLGTLRRQRRWQSGSGDAVMVGGGDSSVPLLLRGEDNKVRAQRHTSPPSPPPPHAATITDSPPHIYAPPSAEILVPESNALVRVFFIFFNHFSRSYVHQVFSSWLILKYVPLQWYTCMF